MTRDETKALLFRIASLYPTFKVTKQNITFLIDSWSAELIDTKPNEAIAALKVYNHTNTTSYAPSISQLLSCIHKLESPELDMSEGEAWDRIYRAICNGSYGAAAEFEKLPPVLQRVVGSPNALRQLAMMDMESISVIQSNCMRTFRHVSKQEFERKSIPDQVHTLIESVTKQLEVSN